MGLMFRTKRSLVAIVLVVGLSGVLLVNLPGGSEAGNEGFVTTDKNDGNVSAAKKDGVDPPKSSPIEQASSAQKDVKDEHENHHTVSSSNKLQEDYCIWSPGDQEKCRRIISRKLQGKFPPRRWLFFGDSTVAQFWKTSSLGQVMVDFGSAQINEACSRRYHCKPKTLDQCNLNIEYQLPPVSTWDLPNWELGEGPASITANECLGCHNCLSTFPLCALVDDSMHCRGTKKILYGGYYAIPFARDVVLQSPSFRSTQQNILAHVETHWNTPQQREDFGGNPVCVVRTGFHDIAVPQMTPTKYVANVRWYLEQLWRQCSHVVWLQNTAPLLHESPGPPDFPQTIERVRAYDQAVYGMVSNLSSPLREMVSTMDVFEASRDWPHNDNIHLDGEWNRALGIFFLKLATKVGS